MSFDPKILDNKEAMFNQIKQWKKQMNNLQKKVIITTLKIASRRVDEAKRKELEEMIEYLKKPEIENE